MVGRTLGLRRARVPAERYPEFLARLAGLVARGGRTRAFVESFALLYALAGGNPSSGDKERLNKAMVEAAGLVRSLLERALREKGVLGVLGVSAAANAVDVEMLEYRFEGELLDALREEPVVRLGEPLPSFRGARVALLLDNAGEAVVDILVAGLLSSLGAEVTLYARSEEYETDVTEEEVRHLLRALSVDLEVRGSGGRYPPHHPVSKTRRELEEYDVVLAKGIANFETMLEAPLGKSLTLSLLRAKCTPIARLLGVEKGKPIIVDVKRVPLRLRG